MQKTLLIPIILMSFHLPNISQVSIRYQAFAASLKDMHWECRGRRYWTTFLSVGTFVLNKVFRAACLGWSCNGRPTLPVSCRLLIWVASQFLEQGVNFDQGVKVQSSRQGMVHSCTRGGMPFICLRHSVISADWLSSEMHETAREEHTFFCYQLDQISEVLSFWQNSRSP